MSPPSRSPFVSGALLALAAAASFGVTTPLVQRFGRHVGPLTTASLLYVGAAIAAFIAPTKSGASPTRAQLPRLALVALAGAVVAPVMLAWGLQRTSATSASLLLNFEAVFTVALARIFFREPIGARVAIAVTLMLAAGGLLVVRASSSSDLGIAGMIAVVIATLAWAIDNALTRPLADFDPSRIVAAKSALGAALTFAMALAIREVLPRAGDAIALALCGATGYGASLRLYLLAQRRIGAARTASLFAIAPFVGVAVAWALGERADIPTTLGAGALFAVAIVLHLTERHGHVHTHDAADHDHAHRHDDGHHDHVHDPPFSGEHSHPHHHDETTHGHEHAPDVHHGHRH